MPQLDIATYTAQLFWLCVSFGILWAGLRLMLPALKTVRDERDAYVLSQVAKAKALELEGERLEEAQAKQLKAAQHTTRQQLEAVTEEMHDLVRQKKAQVAQEAHEKWQVLEAELHTSYHKEKKVIDEKVQPLAEMLLKKVNLCYSAKNRSSSKS